MAERNPNLILFDFDFTLVDASGCLFAALRAGLREVGSDQPSDEQMRSLVGVSCRINSMRCGVKQTQSSLVYFVRRTNGCEMSYRNRDPLCYQVSLTPLHVCRGGTSRHSIERFGGSHH
jgi:phosphoglycolate phosphatase-like HAD superfamily hydrolase